jgi:hypothetical protein
VIYRVIERRLRFGCGVHFSSLPTQRVTGVWLNTDNINPSDFPRWCVEHSSALAFAGALCFAAESPGRDWEFLTEKISALRWAHWCDISDKINSRFGGNSKIPRQRRKQGVNTRENACSPSRRGTYCI